MSTAPFRADEVGSLLRPPEIKEARAKFEEGKLDADGLRAVEDVSIREVVKKQESVGLKAVTDGEFRRSWWHFDFLTGLEGVELHREHAFDPLAEASGLGELHVLKNTHGPCTHPRNLVRLSFSAPFARFRDLS